MCVADGDVLSYYLNGNQFSDPRQVFVLAAGTLGPFAAAEVALRVLHTLARLQPAVDLATGQTLQPLPQAHRAIASPEVLPYIVQASQLCGYGHNVFTRLHSSCLQECLCLLQDCSSGTSVARLAAILASKVVMPSLLDPSQQHRYAAKQREAGTRMLSCNASDGAEGRQCDALASIAKLLL